MAAPYRVLVIEDDDLNFRLMEHILAELPLTVARANTGAQAIEELGRAWPDLIITDVNLPDMRGWDVLDRFKDDPRLNRSRIIVLTAQMAPVHRVIGSLQEVAVYMTKPFKPDDLRLKVRQLLEIND